MTLNARQEAYDVILPLPSIGCNHGVISRSDRKRKHDLKLENIIVSLLILNDVQDKRLRYMSLKRKQ